MHELRTGNAVSAAKSSQNFCKRQHFFFFWTLDSKTFASAGLPSCWQNEKAFIAHCFWFTCRSFDGISNSVETKKQYAKTTQPMTAFLTDYAVRLRSGAHSPKTLVQVSHILPQFLSHLCLSDDDAFPNRLQSVGTLHLEDSDAHDDEFPNRLSKLSVCPDCGSTGGTGNCKCDKT